MLVNHCVSILRCLFVIRRLRSAISLFMLQASAALCINAGALLDPEDLPGLAHYLEHSMLQCFNTYSSITEDTASTSLC